MWQFAEATRGLADGCRALGTPVTGGNVSFYNQTADDGDQPDAGHRRARPARRRRPAHPDGLPGAGRVGAAARRDPRRARRLRVGLGRAPAPRRPPARRRPRARAACSARCSSPARATACCPAPTTCPTAGSRRRWWSPRCRAGSARGSCCRPASTRSSSCSASRPAARSSRCRGRRSCASPRCAAPAACPARASASPTAPRWTSRTCSSVPLEELRTAHEATLPALFGPLAGDTALANPVATAPATGLQLG